MRADSLKIQLFDRVASDSALVSQTANSSALSETIGIGYNEWL